MTNHKFTPKEDKFINEYMVDFNSTQAAIRAGYSKKTAGSAGNRLLKNVEIKAEIEKRQREIGEKVGVTVEYVINGLKTVAERCMQREPALEWNPEEKCKTQIINDDNEPVWQFDSTGANKALELLGKHIGMFNGDDKSPAQIIVNIKSYAKKDRD